MPSRIPIVFAFAFLVFSLEACYTLVNESHRANMGEPERPSPSITKETILALDYSKVPKSGVFYAYLLAPGARATYNPEELLDELYRHGFNVAFAWHRPPSYHGCGQSPDFHSEPFHPAELVIWLEHPNESLFSEGFRQTDILRLGCPYDISFYTITPNQAHM